MAVIGQFEVEDGAEDVTDLLRVPAGAATLTDLNPPIPPWMPPYAPRANPDGQDEDEPAERRRAPTVVSEAAILEAAVHKSEQQPRWPAGTPGGKGGQWIETGQTFMSGGQKWQVAQIVKGTVYAHEASAKYSKVETRAFKVQKGRDGNTYLAAQAQYVPPKQVPVGGKSENAELVIVDPYVDHASHDPSIPIPAGSAVSAEQWQRFGKLDQEHYTELMERFGKHKPGAAKTHVDASYNAYQSKVQQMVKSGYQEQYGSSTGYSLSLAAHSHNKDNPEQAKLREEALALQAEHKAAVQWDLYNRTLSPDVVVTHRSPESASYWQKNFIDGDKAVFSGLSQSWSFDITQFGHNGIITPLSIRHVLLSSHSAQPVPGGNSFPGELEVAVAEQLKLDSRSVAFTEGSGFGALSSVEKKWLKGVMQQPQGGEILDTFLDSRKNGTTLPIPPAKPNITMDNATGKTWADPPAAAATALDPDKLPSVGPAVTPDTLDKSLPWQHLDDNGNPKTVTGVDAGAYAGQYFMGQKGTLYWIGPDPAVGGGYPFRIHKIENGAFNGENFAYNPDLPGYYLDAHFVVPKEEDPGDQTFDPSDWVNGTESAFLEKFAPGDKFKLNGAVYEVTGPQVSTGMPVKDLESGLTGKINGDYKSLKLVSKGSALAGMVSTGDAAVVQQPKYSVGQAVMTPDGHGVIAAVSEGGGNVDVDMTHGDYQVSLDVADVSPWAAGAAPQVGVTFPYSTGPGEAKKATITVLKDDGSVQVNLSPGKVVIPADEWAAYADKTFDPSAWNIAADKVKLRDMEPGTKFQGGAGDQTLRPYEVLAVPPSGKVTVRNMDTGQVSQMSRHVSYRPLEAKPAPGSAAEGAQDTPDSPAAAPSTPVSTHLTENIDPANLEPSADLLKPEQFEVGMVLGWAHGPQSVVTAKGDDGKLTLVNLTSGNESEWEPSVLAPKLLWSPKTEGKSEGNLANLPEPSAQVKNYVNVDGSKYTEGELVKIGDMPPGTVFQTVSKKKGPTYYKISDDGQSSINLKTGKSYPIKGGWKGTVMEPRSSGGGDQGTPGTLDAATFNLDDWENAGGSMPVPDMPVGTVYINADGSMAFQKVGDDSGLVLHDTAGTHLGQTIFQGSGSAWPLKPTADAAAASGAPPHPDFPVGKAWQSSNGVTYTVAGPPLPNGEIPLTGDDGSSFSYDEDTLHAKALVSWTPTDAPAPDGGELPDWQTHVWNDGKPLYLADGSPIVKGQAYKTASGSVVFPSGAGNAIDSAHVTFEDGSAGDLPASELFPYAATTPTPTPVHAEGDLVTVNLPGSSTHGLTGEVQGIETTDEPYYKVKTPGQSAMWYTADELTGANGLQDATLVPPTGELKPDALADKPGALFTHKGVTMSVMEDQSLATNGELIAVAPDGKGWLITESAGGVTPVPGVGPTKLVKQGDTMVYNGHQVTVGEGFGNGGSSGDTPAGYINVTTENGQTVPVNAAELTPLPSPATFKHGELVHVNKPLDPMNPSLGAQNVIAAVEQVLPNGKVQVSGSSMLFKPEHVTSLDAYPFKPGDDVQHTDGSVADFAYWEVSPTGKPVMAVYAKDGTDEAWDPANVSLATVEAPEAVGVVLDSKATQELPHDVLQPGDPAKFSTLQAGDHYLPVGPAGNTGDPWVVISAPESPQHNGKVQKLTPSGEPTGMVYDLYPDAPVLLHAKAADAAAEPAPVETVADLDTLPDASDHGFVGYKSHKGSGGKWSHHMVKTMPEGTVFADLNGKQWKVKQAGAQPVITDGTSLFKVSGQLRGKDLNQPAVKQNANLVDNSPPVGWHTPEPVMVANTSGDTFAGLGLATGDQFKVNNSPDVWQVDAVDGDGFVNASTPLGVSGPATTMLGPAAKPSHVSAAALAKPTPPVPAPDAAPSPDASPTLYTAPATAGGLEVGDQFAIAPGSGTVYTVQGKGAGNTITYSPSKNGFTTMASFDPVYVEPSAPAAPPVPADVPVGQPVDPATVTVINDVDEFADVPPVPADPAPTPQSSGPLQAFGSRLGPGGIYKHDKLSELQVGQLFTDKSGADYQLVSHGEGSAYYKNVATGAVMEAKNDLRVKRTALPPDPGPVVTPALAAVQAKYGGLESVPMTTVTGYGTATGEGGKVKYPRLGHLKAGEQVKAADGTTMTHMASWLDKSLVYMGDGEWRLIPAATRVKRIA